MAVDEKERKGHRDRGEKKVRDPQSDHWRSSFPPYVTVDELWLYRKKKPNVAQLGRDNLRIEEGSFKFLRSEYRRRFKNFYETLKTINGEQKNILSRSLIRPKSSLKLEGPQVFQSHYDDTFRKGNVERLSEPIRGIIDKKHMENGATNRDPAPVEIPTETAKVTGRQRLLLKRPTNLQLQGEYFHITEYAEKFIEYLLAERAKLCRTPTTLKLEGEMASKTETGEKFKAFDTFDRPTLCKKFTELHLEGDLDIRSEKQEKFVPFALEKRPALVKKSTNLHMEGEQLLIPEYKHQYVFYDSQERPKMFLPINNLKTGGLFEELAEDGLRSQNLHPLIPFLRESDGRHGDDDDRTRRHPPRFGRRGPQGQSLSRVLSQPNLGRPEPSEDVQSEKKSSELEQLDSDAGRMLPPTGRRRSRRDEIGLSYLKGDGKLDAEPEYTSVFVDFPRQRPSVRRPVGLLSPDGEVQYITEKADKFVSHNMIEKTESCKRKPELKMEGHFECEPEYRKAYIDYLIREKRPPTVKVTRAVEDGEANGVATESFNENSSEDNGKREPASPLKKIQPTKLLVPAAHSLAVPSSPRRAKRSEHGKLNQPVSSTHATKKLSSGPRSNWSRRSLTPTPRDETRRESSPKKYFSSGVQGDWRAPELRNSASSDTNGWYSSAETDPAFFILDDGGRREKSIRNSLYKEEKWMPSWYSVQ